MAELRIEREIMIDAPVEVVWRTITEPDQISQWFADRVELEAKPRAHGYLGFGDQGGPVVVEAVDPPTRFAFRWNHPADEEPVAANSLLVEFTLVGDGLCVGFDSGDAVSDLYKTPGEFKGGSIASVTVSTTK